MSQQTATQMMVQAEQAVGAQRLHDEASKIPGRTVIVTADVDGRGNVNRVHVPGVVHGQGGTVDILIAAVRQYSAKTPGVSVVVPARLSHTGADRRRECQIDPDVAELVWRLNHPVHGDEPITTASCDGHGDTWPSIHLADGDVLIKMPHDAATELLDKERARRSKQ